MNTLILGAGPAGLAAGWELARRGRPARVLEAAPQVGGLSRTVWRNGYGFDIGGHRFFTRVQRVQALWDAVLPEDFLVRPRMSRILYRGRYFSYPLDPVNALRHLGPVEAARCLTSFGAAQLRPRGDERTFEEWVSNRFGDRLFDIFFRTYTEKVWGIPCDRISAAWAAQRIKNLSLGGAVKSALGLTPAGKVTSLIEEFHYPRRGPGQMYEAMADAQVQAGGAVELRQRVTSVQVAGGRVRGVRVVGADGVARDLPADAVLSSIPLTVLVQILDPPPPPEVLEAARALRFRHLLTINLVVEGEGLFPDTWVYVHSPELKVGRVQNFGNWSPGLVPEPGRSSLGLEYFTEDGDPLWTATDRELIALGLRELRATGLCDVELVNAFVVRAPRAYPIYELGHEAPLELVRRHVQQIGGLQVMGRYGMFKYNNADHSILTALLAVDNLVDGAGHDLWAVNADETYLEEAPAPAPSG